MIRKKRVSVRGRSMLPEDDWNGRDDASGGDPRDGRRGGCHSLDPSHRGELHFQFTDGLALHCAVFLAEGCGVNQSKLTRRFPTGWNRQSFRIIHVGG